MNLNWIPAESASGSRVPSEPRSQARAVSPQSRRVWERIPSGSNACCISVSSSRRTSKRAWTRRREEDSCCCCCCCCCPNSSPDPPLSVVLGVDRTVEARRVASAHNAERSVSFLELECVMMFEGEEVMESERNTPRAARDDGLPKKAPRGGCASYRPSTPARPPA